MYDGTVPWVTTSELREGVIRSTAKGVSRRALDRFSTLRVYPPGAVLIAMYGATIGRVARLGVAATTNQACCAFAGAIHISEAFLFHWLKAFRTQIVSMGVGGGQPNISQQMLRELRVPAPPLAEQDAIVAEVERRASQAQAVADRLIASIDKLREYRQALITAAVTGQLDVTRERAA